MKFKGFLGGSYKLDQVNYDCADTINMYCEEDETGNGKEEEPLILVSRPGYTLVHQIPRPPIRCIWQTQSGNVYVVAGNGVFLMNTTDGENWTHTLIATLTTTTGRVYISDGVPNVVNGQLNTARIVKVVVVDGSMTGVCFTDGSSTTTLLTAGNGYLGSSFVTFQDGFFMFSQPNTPVVYFAADPLNISGTDTIIVNLGPDTIERALSDHDIVWMFGSKTSSVWQNSGGVGYFSPNNLFQQIPGSFSEGSCFPHTVCKISGQLIWLQTDPNGYAQVFQAVGYRGLRISNHSVEDYINTLGDVSNATAWVYQSKGHSFYCLNTGGQFTYCYDISSKTWHQRALFGNGSFSRDLAEVHYGINLPGIGQFNMVGDYSSGNIYYLDDKNYTDNGQPIYRQRTTPHVSSAFKRMQFSRLQLDIEEGVGLDGLGYPYVEGTVGSPVLQTATNVELTGNGPIYYFTANDGSLQTPVTTPTITASGPYSNSYQIVGGQITFFPAPITVPIEQFGLGDGTTTSFNLPSNNGTSISSVIVYTSDWRGNLLQSTSPRTNLVPYSVDFNKGWTTTGCSASPSPTVSTGSTVSSTPTNNSPTPVTPTASANDVTAQLGWNNVVVSPSTTYRPVSVSNQSNLSYNINGSGLATGNSTTIVTSGSNYVSSSATPTISYFASYGAVVDTSGGGTHIFSGFGIGQNLSGTLYVSLSTTTNLVYSSNHYPVGGGEVDVQYKADGMASFVTIAQGLCANDILAGLPISIPLTVTNLATLQVQLIQGGQFANNNTELGVNNPTIVSTEWVLYDIAFIAGFSYVLNAPDGTATGTSIIEDTSQGYHQIQTTYNSIAGNPVSMSIYAIAGDPTRNIKMQLGPDSGPSASAQFNLNNGTGFSTVGTYQITPFASAVPSTGVILVNTVVAANTSGVSAQIAPSVLQTPTNGVVITYLWSLAQSTTGTTLTGTLTSSMVTLNVGAVGTIILECTVTANGVVTIYTQYVTVIASAKIYRISISGTELLTGQQTATIGLINQAYQLGYNNPVSPYLATGWTQSLDYNAWLIAPTIAGVGATNLMANFQIPNPGWTYTWTIQNGTITSQSSGTGVGGVIFTAGQVGNCIISVKITGSNPTINGTWQQVIAVIPSMEAYYPGNGGGYVGLWGCQIEEAVSPTAFIETIGLPLTDLYTLNSTTGNIIFGVAPLEDAVLTASFTITEISAGPIQYFASFNYYEALPNYVYIGNNPQIWLSWSDDGGHSWNNPRSVSMGQIGSYETRCIYRRLGQSRDRVWRIQCSDPVRFTLLGHEADVRISAN